MNNADHRSFLRTATPRDETFTVVEYPMGVEYVPDLYDGFRYDDPMTGIPWPETVAALSTKWARRRLPLAESASAAMQAQARVQE
jgi:hypothetical protein